ncbi:hypothetical protein STENM327S_05446 [Streptomyces tendae]
MLLAKPRTAARATPTDSRRTCAICRSASCRTWSAAWAAVRSAAARSRARTSATAEATAPGTARSRSASGVPSSCAGTSSPPAGPESPWPPFAAAGITVAASCPTHCSAATSCRVSRSACSRSCSARRRACSPLRRKYHAAPTPATASTAVAVTISSVIRSSRIGSRRSGSQRAGADRCLPRPLRAAEPAAMRRTAKAHDMDLPGTREGRYEAGDADDADSRRTGTARPEAPRTPVSATGVRRTGRDHTVCAHVVLTGRVGLVTTTRNRRWFDAKNAPMTAEPLWLKRELDLKAARW